MVISSLRFRQIQRKLSFHGTLFTRIYSGAVGKYVFHASENELLDGTGAARYKCSLKYAEQRFGIELISAFFDFSCLILNRITNF